MNVEIFESIEFHSLGLVAGYQPDLIPRLFRKLLRGDLVMKQMEAQSKLSGFNALLFENSIRVSSGIRKWGDADSASRLRSTDVRIRASRPLRTPEIG